MEIKEINKDEFKAQFKKLMRQMNESFIEHGQGNRTPKPRYFNKVKEFKNLIDSNYDFTFSKFTLIQ